MGKSFGSTPAKFLFEKSLIRSSFHQIKQATPCLDSGQSMQKQGPSPWVCGAGPAQTGGFAMGSWHLGLLLGGRVAVLQVSSAGSSPSLRDKRDARQQTLSLDTQGVQKVRSLQVLAQSGSWLPVCRQGWSPQSLRWSCPILRCTAKTCEDRDKCQWFCLHKKIGRWDYCSTWT